MALLESRGMPSSSFSCGPCGPRHALPRKFGGRERDNGVPLGRIERIQPGRAFKFPLLLAQAGQAVCGEMVSRSQPASSTILVLPNKLAPTLRFCSRGS